MMCPCFLLIHFFFPPQHLCVARDLAHHVIDRPQVTQALFQYIDKAETRQPLILCGPSGAGATTQLGDLTTTLAT